MRRVFRVTIVCPMCSTRQDTDVVHKTEHSLPTYPDPCTECGATFGPTASDTAPLCVDCGKERATVLHFQVPDDRDPSKAACFLFLCTTCHAERHAHIKAFHRQSWRGSSIFLRRYPIRTAHHS